MALMKLKRSVLVVTLAMGALCGSGSTWADTELDGVKAAISRSWAQTMPTVPAVDEVRRTAISGLFEVRVGDSEIVYSDATGSYVIYGDLLDLPGERNLTQERVDVLTAVKFDELPFKDAIVLKRGDGSRRLAVFADPNCSYCHKFEQQLQTVDNVTVYVFLTPILSPDSALKSRNIWCASDRNQAWENWMLSQKPPAEAICDIEPIERNVAMARKYRVTGTPTLIFADGSRIPGLATPAAIEQKFAQIQGAK